jgi:hypothetical protein
MANNALANVSNVKFSFFLLTLSSVGKKHISEVSNELARNIGVRSRVRPVLSRIFFMDLYYSLTNPFISYGKIGQAHIKPVLIRFFIITEKMC